MDSDFSDCLANMERWFTELETKVPRPIKVPFLDHFVFRYKEKTLEQALILKLVRIVTGLHSLRILLIHGFYQEQSAIQRMVDEFEQDILFLSYARLEDEITDLHQRYLDYFYEEEFDVPNDPVASTQKRPSIPQKKIHAYISRIEAKLGIGDECRGKELSRTLSKAYSGFVHGGSTQILNLYGGEPSRFNLTGMSGTPHEPHQWKDAWNCFYRGICAFNTVAYVLDAQDIAYRTNEYAVEFARKSGKDYFPKDGSET